LLHLKSQYGVNALDYVIITHPHRDHIDDIFNFQQVSPGVLQRPKHLTAQEVRGGNQATDFKKVDKYLEVSDSYSAPLVPLQKTEVPENWGGVSIKTFTSLGCNKSNLNNHSIVTVFEYLGFKVIVPGDNEKESWLELLKQPEFRSATEDAHAMLAPHHGRDAGYCAELLDHVRPHLVIISDGPEGETSATQKYADKIRQWRKRGWRAYYRDDTWDERFCVTTRCDGKITLQIYEATDKTNRLNVFLYDGTGSNRD
jgi:beta-lactamase superfamily II metal-dependent hydrolase